MRTVLLAAAVALASAGWALGQANGTPPLPTPKPVEVLPKPSEPAARAPFLQFAPPPVADGCEPGCSFDSGVTGEAGLFTASADYLLYFFPIGRPSTTLTTNAGTNNIVGTPIIIQSDTPLFQRPYSGGRLSFGYWLAEPNRFTPLSELRTAGAEVRLFMLGEQSQTLRDDISPAIIRPFFDLNNRTLNGVVVGFPGLATGNIAAVGKMNLWGAEANVWKNLFYNRPYTTYGLGVTAGFRYMEADPSVEIRSQTQYAQDLTAFPAFQSLAGSRITTAEFFGTRSRFYGGQLGVDSQFYLASFIVDASFKLALGCNDQQLLIDGVSVRNNPNGTTVTSPGVLYALPSNIGKYNRNTFSQIPEINVAVRWPVLNRLTLRLDFDAMYWSKFLRAREQIDPVVDVTQIPNFPAGANATPTGFARPGVRFRESDLWILGLGLGAEFKW